jgi:hypothetical protein
VVTTTAASTHPLFTPKKKGKERERERERGEEKRREEKNVFDVNE